MCKPPPPAAGSSRHYWPWGALPRAGSPYPYYAPSRPSSPYPYYAPPNPPSLASSPDYKHGTQPWPFLVSRAELRMPPHYTPGRTPCSSHQVSDEESRMARDYTQSTGSQLVSDAESPMSPDYTPSTPTSRAASPDYKPALSHLVSDAESRMSRLRLRDHPYQRTSASTGYSRASRISRGRLSEP
jgi:DNA-directed RNA polymerase II subunit RPB1